MRGDFGVSMEWRLPVADLIWDRLGWTVFLAALTILIGYVIAIPIGVYSATHQYSKLDNLINAWGFLGLGIPNFTMALAVMWFAFAYFGCDLSGLFSDEFRNAPWSLGKVGEHARPPLAADPDPGLGRGRRRSSGPCAPTCWTSCTSRTSRRRGPAA